MAVTYSFIVGLFSGAGAPVSRNLPVFKIDIDSHTGNIYLAYTAEPEPFEALRILSDSMLTLDTYKYSRSTFALYGHLDYVDARACAQDCALRRLLGVRTAQPPLRVGTRPCLAGEPAGTNAQRLKIHVIQ